MYQLKAAIQVIAESSKPIEYSEDERAWFCIGNSETTWFVDPKKQFEVVEVADPAPGAPSVIG